RVTRRGQTSPALFPYTTRVRSRRESIIDMMRGRGREIARFEDWQAFLEGSEAVGVTIAPIEGGVLLPADGLAIITEHQLIGEKRSEEHTSELQSRETIVCRLLI